MNVLMMIIYHVLARAENRATLPSKSQKYKNMNKKRNNNNTDDDDDSWGFIVLFSNFSAISGQPLVDRIYGFENDSARPTVAVEGNSARAARLQVQHPTACTELTRPLSIRIQYDDIR